MSGIRVTVTDLDTGDSESTEIENDYVLICDGTAHLCHTQVTTKGGTHVLTVKGVQR